MTPNVGSVDRAIRIVVGIVILALGIAYKSWWGLIGLLPLATGLIRRCPGYLPFRISTCPRQGKPSDLPQGGASR